MSRFKRMSDILTETFTPSLLEILDESHLHRGHNGHTGRDETHFCVTIGSDIFEGKSRVAIHRLINAALKDELDSGLHALRIVISPS